MANLVWHQGSVTEKERSGLLGQRPLTIWLTGLSGAGKSTLAAELEARLIGAGQPYSRWGQCVPRTESRPRLFSR
ncbi:MAG: adenylyl-sulfate kinase [Dechloromonas sp.]|nr:adenylyl-sulfate kinase [Dechloromonas sp.]